MEYYVALNLNRDLIDYVPGDTIDVPDDVAQDLLAAGVLSTDKVDATPAVDVTPEIEPQIDQQPEVGGAPATSGEPSLDATSDTTPAPAPAVDVTPEVDYESMTRAQLNALAVDKGATSDAVEALPNKAAVIDVIKNALPANDPSVNL